MNFYFDTEFNQRLHKPLFGKQHVFIDLISIAIVKDNDQQYCAVSKDFDIKAAWFAYQLEQVSGDQRNVYPEGIKKYWLRENVLKPIWEELCYTEYRENPNEIKQEFWDLLDQMPEEKRLPFFVKNMLPYPHKQLFNLGEVKRLVKKYGRTKKEIAEDVKSFVWRSFDSPDDMEEQGVDLYAYFASFYYVLLGSIFGLMKDLPMGFPMYCKDLKQYKDDKADMLISQGTRTHTQGNKYYPKNKQEAIEWIEKYPAYPKQQNEHNALADAIWNKKLHAFLKTL